ncbi:LytTR family DNA-binding domain-containing protein [Porphyromonadaceae bacterium W3.11]|nr:LytTR family DNA-binding domain-containing protein [Porphyromonadaceae bacterium W3.11]
MNAVIVEDEFIAAQGLERLIVSVNPEIKVIEVLQTVEECVEWFRTHEAPDMVFMDIHLADGDSFTIFQQVEITAPIIFTTAYDEYALKAFEVNSIDYLLKPITRKSLERALDKMKRLTHEQSKSNKEMVEELVHTIRSSNEPYKRHFLIPYKDRLIPVSTDDIAYIFSEEKMAKVVCFNQQSYLIDESLDEMLRQLSAEQFFRANRQYIISHKAIVDIAMWFNGKLVVNLSVPAPERIIVSRARSTQFKEWYVSNTD